MPREFEVGDLVRLVSGSPLLTVTEAHPVGIPHVGVEWMVDGEVRTHVFPVVALRLDEEVSDA